MIWDTAAHSKDEQDEVAGIFAILASATFGFGVNGRVNQATKPLPAPGGDHPRRSAGTIFGKAQ